VTQGDAGGIAVCVDNADVCCGAWCPGLIGAAAGPAGTLDVALEAVAEELVGGGLVEDARVLGTQL
jgi:hypothetical protein